MKILKLKSILFSLIAMVMFTVFITSCERDNINVEIPNEVNTAADKELSDFDFESSTIELKKDEPIIKALMASDDFKNFNQDAGKLVWDMASMITYESDEALPIIIIPIDNGDDEKLSMFVSAYNEKKNSFHSFLNDFEISNISMIEEGYTGNIEYKTVDNFSVLKTTYENGNLLYEQEFEINELAFRGVDVSCWLNCMRPYNISAVLAGLGSFCGSGTACCINVPSHLNPCCYAVAGCALWYGGTAGYCAWKCWY